MSKLEKVWNFHLYAMIAAMLVVFWGCVGYMGYLAYTWFTS